MTWFGVGWRLLLAVGLGAAALWAACWMYRTGHAKATAECNARQAAAQEAARLADRARLAAQSDATRRIDHDAHQALRAAQARAAAARADADGLRRALDDLRSDRADAATTAAGCNRLRHQRDGLADLLAEGAELLAEGAQAGDRLAAAHAGLRRYVTEVCRVPVGD